MELKEDETAPSRNKPFSCAIVKDLAKVGVVVMEAPIAFKAVSEEVSSSSVKVSRPSHGAEGSLVDGDIDHGSDELLKIT